MWSKYSVLGKEFTGPRFRVCNREVYGNVSVSRGLTEAIQTVAMGFIFLPYSLYIIDQGIESMWLEAY